MKTKIIQNKFKWSAAICCIILIEKGLKGVDKRATLAHEFVHINRQKQVGCIRWILKYIFSKKFRLHEEFLAFTAEAAVYLSQVGWVDWDCYVQLLQEFPYRLSRKEAKEFVRRMKNAAIGIRKEKQKEEKCPIYGTSTGTTLSGPESSKGS